MKFCVAPGEHCSISARDGGCWSNWELAMERIGGITHDRGENMVMKNHENKHHTSLFSSDLVSILLSLYEYSSNDMITLGRVMSYATELMDSHHNVGVLCHVVEIPKVVKRAESPASSVHVKFDYIPAASTAEQTVWNIWNKVVKASDLYNSTIPAEIWQNPEVSQFISSVNAKKLLELSVIDFIQALDDVAHELDVVLTKAMSERRGFSDYKWMSVETFLEASYRAKARRRESTELSSTAYHFRFSRMRVLSSRVRFVKKQFFGRELSRMQSMKESKSLRVRKTFMAKNKFWLRDFTQMMKKVVIYPIFLGFQVWHVGFW